MVFNAHPSVQLRSAMPQTLSANLTLRVAGERWHDVTLTFVQGDLRRAVTVIREPGSPNDQIGILEDVSLNHSLDPQLLVTYTPEDDPVNGEPGGATPAWILLTTADDREVLYRHTFNANHPETWRWEQRLMPAVVPLVIRFEVSAVDAGSDDLAFDLDFGDGTSAEVTFFNDGMGPDPADSPDGTFPFRVAFAREHTYSVAGTFVVTVVVLDDDGGSDTTQIVVTL